MFTFDIIPIAGTDTNFLIKMQKRANFDNSEKLNVVNVDVRNESESDKAMVSRILQTIPLRKVATPSDIAHAILYLSSDKSAGHVSGQTITVAGGMDGRVLFSRDEVEEYMKR